MQSIETYLVNLAHSLPLEVFVFVGSFLEEVVAPIPSPSILVIAGSFAVVQQYTFSGLIAIVLFASIGKTLGGLTMYFIAHKVKDIALPYVSKFLGVTQFDIDRFGSRFTGSVRDYAIYIFFRAVPIIPSILLSFGSGVLRLPLRLFVIGTFVGTVLRDTFYLWVGYKGTEVLGAFLNQTTQAESLVEILALIAILSGFIYLFYRKRKQRTK